MGRGLAKAGQKQAAGPQKREGGQRGASSPLP